MPEKEFLILVAFHGLTLTVTRTQYQGGRRRGGAVPTPTPGLILIIK